jgi:hypothetical protein
MIRSDRCPKKQEETPHPIMTATMNASIVGTKQAVYDCGKRVLVGVGIEIITIVGLTKCLGLRDGLLTWIGMNTLIFCVSHSRKKSRINNNNTQRDCPLI